MEFMDLPLYDPDITKLALRFAHNLFFLALIVRFALIPNGRDREFTFTAVMLNIVVFFICFTMKKLDIGLGMALGLFAIFGGVSTFVEVYSNIDALTMVASVMAGSLVWWVVLSNLIGRVRHRIDAIWLKRINRLAGVLLVAFGLLLIGEMTWKILR